MFKGREKKKQVIYTPEYLDKLRGADLKNFQDQAATWNKKIEDAKTEYADIMAKIEQSQKDHKQWLIDKTAEIDGKIEELKIAKDEAMASDEKRRELDREQTENLKELQSQMISSERRAREEKEKTAQHLSDIQAERSNLEARQYKLESDIKHNQNILNDIEIKIRKNKEVIADEEEKRHELIQIEGRIDAGLERLENEKADREEQMQRLSGQLKDLKEKLAQADKLARDQREFLSQKNAHDLWIKDKDKQEADLLNRIRQADVREKSLNTQAEALTRREANVQKAEKEIIP